MLSLPVSALCFLLSCSAWSWSAPLSLTGVLSWWSTVENATRTWSTHWEPAPWASSCPPRTSSLVLTSSSHPDSTTSTTSKPCRRHWWVVGIVSIPTSSPFSLSPALYLSLLCFLSSLLYRGCGNKLLLFFLYVCIMSFLLSGRSSCPSGVYSSTAALYTLNGLPLPPTHDRWLLQNPSQGSLFQEKNCVIKWHSSDCTCNIRLTLVAPYGVVCVSLCVCAWV